MDKSKEKLVTLLTFTYPSEMYVLRSRLESEGIACLAQDELTIQVNPLYSNALGGVKLQVLESDVERALEILREGGYMDENQANSSKEKE
ncbi:MAG: hypothetical protein EZS26_001511 [Candidatus Ordinivivax streblomastigis]|uniref:DUF2007 domain-containing protein n=1 Tax=Candidatus Ordinivivax streblomastigis TaxID=2540710 RepID=A0A5M8P1Y7_9BACT|nr:MAG: hypothetical protein EZS26_001511 [Candidatus Ordinivivax streblomastigis]